MVVAAGVVAVDDACHRGVPVREFERQVALMSHWPHISTARAALAFADAGAESPGQSLSRILLAELGLGPIQTQFAVLAGDRIVWCDLRVGCHVFEFDGLVMYRDVAYGGVATRDASPRSTP